METASDFAVGLLLLGPFDVWVDVIDVCEEWRDVIFVNCSDGIIRFPQPEENDVGWSYVFTSGIVTGKRLLFEVWLSLSQSAFPL